MNAPSLPTFGYLPYNIAIDSSTGYAYSLIAQVNPVTTITIFTVRGLAHTLFYQLANSILEGEDLQSHKIFIATSAAVNLSFLVVIREFNLIGRFFSIVVGSIIVGHLIHRVRYIQDQEVLDPDLI